MFSTTLGLSAVALRGDPAMRILSPDDVSAGLPAPAAAAALLGKGGAAALLGLRAEMDQLNCTHTLRDFEGNVGRELGVVRVSLGLASNFHDVYRVLAFARAVGTAETRATMWDAWVAARAEVDWGTHAPTDPLHNTGCIELEGDPDSGWRLLSWHSDPLGGHYLEAEGAPDPTGQNIDEDA